MGSWWLRFGPHQSLNDSIHNRLDRPKQTHKQTNGQTPNKLQYVLKLPQQHVILFKKPFLFSFFFFSFSALYPVIPSQGLLSESCISLTKHESTALSTAEATLKKGNNIKEKWDVEVSHSYWQSDKSCCYFFILHHIFRAWGTPQHPTGSPAESECEQNTRAVMKNSYATVRMQEMGYCKRSGDYVMLQVVLAVRVHRETETDRGRV